MDYIYNVGDAFLFGVVAFLLAYFVPGSRAVKVIVTVVVEIGALGILQWVVMHQIRFWEPVFVTAFVVGTAAGSILAIRLSHRQQPKRVIL